MTVERALEKIDIKIKEAVIFALEAG